MSEGNGTTNPTRKDAGVAIYTIVIQFDPNTLALGVQWPPCDAVTQLGMIEFAKTSLLEQRLRGDNKIVQPSMVVIPRGNV